MYNLSDFKKDISLQAAEAIFSDSPNIPPAKLEHLNYKGTTTI